MKHFIILSLIFTLLVPFAAADVPPLQVRGTQTHVSGNLVACIPANSISTAQDSLQTLETWGYTQTRREITFSNITFRLYEAADRSVAKDVAEAISLFNESMSRESNGVKLLANYIFRVSGDINEPCFNRKDTYQDRQGNRHNILLQWDMSNPGEFGGVLGADLNVTKAWEIVPKKELIKVAVIDTGVDIHHPGLKGRLLRDENGKVIGKDSTAWWGKGSFLDDHGHGSHCAGSIAAAYNDGEGMTGSSGPTNVKIIPVKALSKEGAGDLFSISDAMKWSGLQGADIISMSLGAIPIVPEQEPILKQAFDAVVNSAELKNSIVIAAAGNNGKDIHTFPAFCDRVIAIGASDHQDQLAVFSNFGNWVDVAAPGVNIVSLRPKHDGRYLDMYQDAGHKKAEYAIGNNSKSAYDKRKYFIASGTSMACPNAAGVAAMVLAANTNLKANTEKMREILMETSDKKGTLKIKQDGGRVNAFKAVQAALQAK